MTHRDRRRDRQRVRHLSRCVVALLVGALLVSCSGGDEPGNLVLITDPGANRAIGDDPTAATENSLDVAPLGAWADGRAVYAAAAPDNSLVVVTTTGVDVIPSGGGEAIRLDTFAGATQLGVAALSDDGSTLAVTSSNPSVMRRYDVLNRSLLGTVELPLGDGVAAVDFLPDDRGVIAMTSSGPAVWRADPALPLDYPFDGVTTPTAVLLADGTMVAPSIGTRNLVTSDGQEVILHPLSVGEDATVFDLRVSPQRAALAVTSAIGDNPFERQDSISIVDPTTWQTLGSIDFQTALDQTTWTITDRSVIVASGSNIEAWNFDGTPLTIDGSPTERPIGRLVATSSGILAIHGDGTVVEWSEPTAADATWAPRIVAPGGVAPFDTALSADDTTVTVVDRLGGVVVLDVPAATSTSDDRYRVGEITSVAINASGTNIAASSNTGVTHLFSDSVIEEWSTPLPESAVRVDTAEFEPTTGRLVTGLAERTAELAFDDTVTVWDLSSDQIIAAYGGESEDVAGCSFFFNRIRFTTDGSVMATTSHDFSVSLIDSATGATLHRLVAAASPLLDITISPDDQRLVATRDNGAVEIWNIADGSLTATYPSTPGGYVAIAVLPDGATMAAINISGAASLVDLATGETIRTFAGSSYRATSIALSPDGSIVAVPTADSNVVLWSTADGTQLATITGHASTVTDIAFAPDGTWLATSSRDGTVRTWAIGPDTGTDTGT